ncbi:hypothetical protein CONLIGDRAFT_517395 [Coniochaeta ligniaria NRRL 30616]|uniref:DUF1772-domain-containing protein n=1 Tax=Coniochaeta ligniaria NRRL 30616 TaxID=1408157 RepID=A0A1J7IF40_9PEZI|nr:hypothetical protein CONLIGDRAFT_517395 [Coniochaeta ligniaria NRRL 30616]
MASIRGLQGATVFNTGILAGVALSFSSVGVALILESPTNLSLLRQWSMLRWSSRLLFSGAVPVLVGVPYALLAYAFRASGAKARLYLLSAALCLSPGLYGRFIMAPTEKRLEEKMAGMSVADEAAEVLLRREGTAKYLVDHWGVLNLGRVAMVAGAGLSGLVASLSGR